MTHPPYARDLPSDLLDLIDHTTRGVRRLYASTQCAEMSTHPDTTEDRPITTTTKRTKRRTSTTTTGTSAVNERSEGKSNGVESREEEEEENIPRRASTAVRSRPQHSNHYNTSTEDDLRGTVHRWTLRRTQAIPTNNTTEDRSITSTVNTTLSLDGHRRQPPTLHSIARGPHSSITSTVNTSATGMDDRSGLQLSQKWKDTFKSLLSGAVEPNRSNTAPLSSSTVDVSITHQQENHIAQVTQDSKVPLTSIVKNNEQDRMYEMLKQSKATVERLQQQLKEQDESHRRELSELRTEHSSELAQLRREIFEARQKAEEEVSTQLLASFSVKQKLLQAEVVNERMRAEEMNRTIEERNKTIERLHAQLEEASGHLRQLQSEVDAKERQVKELRDNVLKTRKDLAALEEEVATRVGELAESKRREKLAVEREKESQSLVNRLESQLREQEQRSREELHRLEEEFHSTSKSYQNLIGEATDKLTALEKVERKYRTLKEQNRQQKQQLQEEIARLTSVQDEKQQHLKRIEELQQDVETLRLQLARKEHEMREERASQHHMVDSLKKQLEEEEDKACQERENLQKSVRHTEECMARLQREMESLTQQLEEERQHSKELLVKLEESALRHQEDLASVRQAASSYQQQTESILASMRRQLREKDAKLQALASTASEPIQRLRSQLEDERGRRATLEEQFNRYKQKAKAAEEAALREIRREQNRASSSARSQSQSSSVPAAPTKTSSTTTGLGVGLGLGETVTPVMPLSSTRTTSSSSTAAAAAMREEIGSGSSLPVSMPHHGSGLTTPTDQRLPKALVPPLPRAHNRRNLHSPTVSPSRTVGNADIAFTTTTTAAAAAVMVTASTPHIGWDSVGSISNISCSSPLCSSREGDTEGIDPAMTNPASGSNYQISPPDVDDSVHEMLTHSSKPFEERHIDDKMAQHEQVLREFHESAAEVFRKITGNRDEFLAKCTSVVRAVSHHPGDRERSLEAESRENISD
ncbi:BRCT domain-containing protein [Trypanosoma theileri]|uniref:BRCT domain-containing protein n=1 Tax=Trypanosoma theileri TaxID=67003 RepID=A0A1X0NWI6_9TRYP|nr:BRCT domain-containing protein [Trypanosoma theileri]ORC89042.1 BRCT domain-containing protein [Trypanosoma theileri]